MHGSSSWVFFLSGALTILVACNKDGTASDSSGSDDTAEETAPYVQDVLDCTRFNGVQAGDALQRFDLTSFPEARCNDGTVALFYYRPASTTEAHDRWLIELQGGGSCESPDDCARRWCGVDTTFSATAMSSSNQPSAWRAEGILAVDGALGVPNPFGAWNHVFIHYCSSDQWAGTQGPIDLDAVDPVTGDPVRYRIEFNGAAIFDAAIATLRREGATVPAYTLGGGSTELPDLDDATEVVLAGASAGGSGVIHNGDLLGATLRANNTACQGASCPLRYGVIVDSIFGPDRAELDYSTAGFCTEPPNWCTYQDHMEHAIGPQMRGLRPDDTCLSWHEANAPTTAWMCNDSHHEITHHLTSQMVVRMGLRDSLVGPQTVAVGFSVPGQGPLTMDLFGVLVGTELTALPTLASEEARADTPAVFGPPCGKHETLDNDASFYGVTIEVDANPLGFVRLLANQAAGSGTTAAVWNLGDPVDCE